MADPSARASRAPQVQRKFGFELEVPLLLTSTDQDGDLGDPKSIEGQVHVADTIDDNEVHVDHMKRPSPSSQLEAIAPRLSDPPSLIERVKYTKYIGAFKEGPPILELTTKPWDETQMTEAEVGQKMDRLAQEVDAAFNATQAGLAWAPNRYGGKLNLGSPNPAGESAGSPKANVQATYGIQTSQVPALFAMQAQLKPDEVASRTLTLAVAAAEAVTAKIEQQRVWAAVDVGARDRVRSQIKGFLALVANYLIAFNTPELKKQSALGKNKVGQLFYKSDLSDLLVAIVGKDPELSKVLGANPLFNRNVATWMLSQTGVKGLGVMFTYGATSYTFRKWTSDVLTGNGDYLVTALKNPYSSELAPEELGAGAATEVGPIVENRRLDFLFPTEKQQWYETSQLAGLAKDLYAALRRLNRVT